MGRQDTSAVGKLRAAVAAVGPGHVPILWTLEWVAAAAEAEAEAEKES